MILKLIDTIRSEDSRSKKYFNIFVQLLIVLSLITFSIETLPHLDPDTKVYLRYFELFIISVFSFEYVARVLFSRERKKYIFSFFGIIDLLAILPFYLALGFDLRTLRTLRLLRLVRILKLARYNTALRRLSRAFTIAKEELALFLCAALIILYLAGVGIYYFESEAQPEVFSSIFHSLWWAVATLTTVGYGDVYPITVGGKVFTFFILIIGLGVVSIPAGMVASALSEAREMDDE